MVGQSRPSPRLDNSDPRPYIHGMFAVLHQIAEERIRRAQEEGAFDDLPGKGRPLPRDDWDKVPQELRMAYKILKNSGNLPPEVEQERELLRAIDLLAELPDEAMRYQQMRKLDVMIRRINVTRRRPVHLEDDDEYYRRIVEKVRVAERRFGGEPCGG